MAFTQSGPGLLYVNSKIGNLELTDEIFNQWYNDVHVPDVFLAKGIKSASRYKTSESGPVERPYLALYPMQDVQHLQSQDFLTITNQSDLLPNKGNIFETVNFDIRYVTHLKTFGPGQIGEH
jgi:hypothetical protein